MPKPRNAKASRPEKHLVVWDLDNTLTDTVKTWALSTSRAMARTASLYDMDPATVQRSFRKTPSQFRFYDFTGALQWMASQKILPQGANPVEETQLKATQWAIRDRWMKEQKEFTTFYPEAVETLRGVRDNGAQQVIYSDTEATSLILRLWFLAQNAQKSGQIADFMEIPALFDHFYCQPSIESDNRLLSQIDPAFVQAIKRNMTLWGPHPVTGKRLAKPSPRHLKQILNDFSCAPNRAVMVGDSDKDGATARPLKVAFAWHKRGCVMEHQTAEAATKMSDPGYVFGVRAIEKAMKRQDVRPNITLSRSLTTLFTVFNFKTGHGFSHNIEQTGTGSGHTPENPEYVQLTPIPPVHRLAPYFQFQGLRSPLGPATHQPLKLPTP
ncbi:HAD family hydrolase [Micavibrio aeruginosavorus]|uniref:HAD family hydrolase n=1 Tax=Micavibrio aeruginosavorus TaxID=349221 RepID=UPI003F4A86CC